MDVSKPFVIIFNRIKKLRMKSDQIESIEESQLMGDKISKKEHKLLHSKPLVNARLDELVKLCQLLYPTLTEDLDLYENSESESVDSAAEDTYFGNWFLAVNSASLILKLISRLEDSTFVKKVLEEAAIEFRQEHPYYPCVQDPSSSSRLDDRYSSREKITSRLVSFGFERDSIENISFILDAYFARKLKADFKKQAEVEETLAHAHIETDTDVATKTITTKGHVEKWIKMTIIL